MRERAGIPQNYLVLYLDTSALIKFYVEEEYTDVVERAVGEATEVHTSEIAYLEARCAFARLREDAELDEEQWREAVDCLDTDWPSYDSRKYDADLADSAAKLADQHRSLRLRTYDALHLASAIESRFEKGISHTRGEIEARELNTRFLCFDRRLVQSSRDWIELYFDPFPEQVED